jgi:hypothetical protein
VPRVPPFDGPATYDDLVELPDRLVAEIAGGELYATPAESWCAPSPSTPSNWNSPSCGARPRERRV